MGRGISVGAVPRRVFELGDKLLTYHQGVRHALPTPNVVCAGSWPSVYDQPQEPRMPKKSILIALPGEREVKVKWFDNTTRDEIEFSIRAMAELKEKDRFELLDDEGDVIVLSSSIPNNTKLTLRIVGKASNKRRHSKSEGGSGSSAKRLRSGTSAVKAQVVSMGFEMGDVEACAGDVEKQGEDVTVSNLLQALVRAERKSNSMRDEDEPDAVCCICLDGFENKALFITECGHKYHFNCIKKYCEKGKEATSSCPLCRQSLLTPPAQSKRAYRHQSNARRDSSRNAAAAAAAAAAPAADTSNGQRAQNPVVGNDPGSQPPQLEEWKYVFNTGVVKGEVYNYPGHDDAAPISTSRVARSEGSIFMTSSGE